ncbi:MAG TPA: M56 family metallopeptidase [Pirellulales bacterium]|jgi:beta-lactamase regulating signal transducer with metallopeptidase domain|nr:M56 family metallopeptidase [Pirellulales bacterium]
MSSFALELLSTLGRTTLWLGLVGVVTAGLLRLARANSPTVHRAGCVLTLLVGWAFLRYPVAVPWYEMAAVGPISGEEPASVAVIDLQTDSLRAGQAPDKTAPIDIADSPLEIAGTTNLPLEQPDANAHIPEDPNSPTPHLQAAAGPTSAPSISAAAWLDRWPVAVLALWAAGLVVLPAIWLVGYVRFVRSLRSCRQPVDAWQSQWSELIGGAPLGRRISLCVSDDIGPMLCRLPRGYVLVVPEPLWRELSDEGRRAILRHELAHYLRGDVWKSLAVRLLALPHWFNPVSWWAVRRFDEAAEWACDAAASADTRSTEYAKTLVRLGELSTSSMGYGSAARGHTLAARVRRVLDMRARPDSVWKQAFALSLVLAIGLASVFNVELVARERTSDGQESPSAKTETNVGPDEQPSPDGATAEGRAAEQPGPTVSPELNLLQVESDPAKKDAVGKTSVKPEGPGKDQKVAEVDAVGQAAKKMVEQAERAFEATQAAYEAETTTLEAVYGWSLRWMRAAQNAAQTPKQKSEAAPAHLDRMRNVQKKVHLLYVAGSRGGEAKDEAAANYYVAEAERIVAEAGGTLDSHTPPGAQATASLFAHQISEAKIALATDDADLLKAEARMQVAKEKLATVTRAKPGAVAQVEIAHKKAEVQLLEAELNKLQYIRNLHEQNLARLLAADQQRAAEPPAAAERIVAEAKAASEPDKTSGVPINATSSEQQISDAKIALAVDEAELRATEARLQVAKERLATMSRVKPGTISAIELTQAKAEVRMLEASLQKFSQIRALHEENLKRLQVSAQAPPAPATAQPERLGLQPQRKLLYSGKTFDEWAEQLRTDLSPDSRQEAINALAAFGAHGMGREAAEAIVAAALEYGVHLKPDSDWTQVSVAASALNRLPVENVLPHVKKLLSSQDAAERIFAMQVVRGMSMKAADKDPLLAKMLDDPDPAVVRMAVSTYLYCAPGSPALLPTLKKMLASPDDEQVEFALKALNEALGNTLRPNPPQERVEGTQRLFNSLVPDVIPAFERGEKVSRAVTDLFRNYTRLAKEGLENALHSTDPKIRDRADSILKKGL